MKKLMLLFFLMMFVIGTDTFLLSPLLPTLQQQFGVAKDAAGWMVSAYALGYAVFALVAGPLSDRLDRKKVMMYGMLGFAASTALCGLSSGFWPMVLFRFFAGVSAAFAAPQVWAAMMMLLPPGQVVRGMGIATAGLALLQAFGVPIGSCLAVSHWSTPFFVIGLSALLLTLFIFGAVPSLPPVQQGARRSPLQMYRSVLGSSAAQKVLLAYFLFQTGNFGRFSFIGMWFSDKFGFGTAAVGAVMLWFGFGNLLGSFVGPSLVHRYGTTKILLPGLCLVSLVAFIIPFLRSAVVIEGAWLVTAATFGVMFPVMMNVLQSLSTTARGTIASLANAVMYGGSTIGTAVTGLLYANLGGFFSVSMFTTVCFLIALFLYISSGLLPRRSPVEQTAMSPKLELGPRELREAMEFR